MKKRFGVLAMGLVLGGAMLGGGVAEAKSDYLTAFKTKYGIANRTKLDSCLVCHTNAIPTVNPYGRAVRAKLLAGMRIGGALTAVQPLDSDRDTFTNIREIRARTWPGRAGSHP